MLRPFSFHLKLFIERGMLFTDLMTLGIQKGNFILPSRWMHHVLFFFAPIFSLQFSLVSDTHSLPHYNPEKAHDYVEMLNEQLLTSEGIQSDTIFLLAQLNSQIGHKETAIQMGFQAHHLQPEDSSIALFLIKLLVREDRLSEVRSLCHQLPQEQQQIPELMSQWGMVEERLGDLEKAHELYAQAIRTDPNHALSHMLLGKILLKNGETNAALNHLQTACRLDNRQANAYYALSRAQLKAGDNDSALRTMKKFRRLKEIEMAKADKANQERNNDQEMRHLLASFHTETGVSLIRNGQMNQAESHLKQATLVASGFSRGFENLANFYLQKRHFKEAKAALEHLVKLVPDNHDFHLNLGTVYIQLRDAVNAVQSLEKAMELSPSHPVALSNLSRLYLGMGRKIHLALKMCLKLVELDKSAAHYDLLAWAHYANGDLDAAIDASAQSVLLEPQNPGYRQRNLKLIQLKGEK